MSMWYLPFTITLCSALLISISCGKEHKFKLQKLEKSKQDANALESEMRLGAPNEEGIMKISGELKQLVSIDNKWQVHISIHQARKSDGTYLELLKIPVLGVCDALKSYYKQHFYEKLKEYGNAPHPDNCPLPPETYHIKDYPFDASPFKKFLMVGYYRIVAKLTKDGETKLEYMAEAIVE